ncbi:MAG: hypothetical protein LC808_25910 [Actinobacteria bacterium]|nr:hypothetical protein [Actinomycetota bacterium]
MTKQEFLNDSVSAAGAGAAREITVRDLIAQWGARGRGSRVVARIRADLRRVGLVTEPDFRQVALDVTIKLAQRPVEAKSASDAEETPDFGLTIGTLPSAAAGVVGVSPSGSLVEAQTLMLVNDYSQLAVIAGERSLKGAVTWQGIAEALMRSDKARLADAIVDTQPVRYSDDLLGLVPTIVEKNFVFVQDETTRITGIVTTADVGELFAERTRPFLLIGEIDQRLRDLISQHFALKDIQAVCKQSPVPRVLKSFNDLTMGDYEQVLGSPPHWERLGWPLDRKIVLAKLVEVRDTRNDVMHFNPDPIDPPRLSALIGLVELLRKYR